MVNGKNIKAARGGVFSREGITMNTVSNKAAMPAVAGINPATRECVIVGIDDPSTWAEIREAGYIAVPLSMEKARFSWGQKIPDIYALSDQPTRQEE